MTAHLGTLAVIVAGVARGPPSGSSSAARTYHVAHVYTPKAQWHREGSRRSLIGTAVLGICALPRSARASYTLYKAASDARDEKLRQGTWKQGKDIDDAVFQGMAARSDAERIRRDRYKMDVKKGNAGKFCAGQMSVVSPQMENICVRYGLSKADRATQYIDEFGNAQQDNTNR